MSLFWKSRLKVNKNGKSCGLFESKKNSAFSVTIDQKEKYFYSDITQNGSKLLFIQRGESGSIEKDEQFYFVLADKKDGS